MLPKNITFVDVETTGLSPLYDRIIEIGIIRTENGKIVEEFSSLINPETYLNPSIQTLTGISPQELENAPTFYNLRTQIKELLAGSVFAAHSVLFDYGFIKNEFKRYEESFSMKYFCTVKLAKYLFPRYKLHNLDAIIERFQFTCQRRHRALDDAKVLWDLYQHGIKTVGEKKLEKAVDRAMRKPTIPLSISEKNFNQLPEEPGVYIFEGSDEVPLYIGKSTNIRARVLSHFASAKNSTLEMKISKGIKNIQSITTAGELGALLLESKLIKKHQPLYNRQLRHASKLLVLKKKKNPKNYSLVASEILEQIDPLELESIIGIFKSQKQMKNHLHNLAKEYSLCPKLLGIEKTKKNCFSYYLNRCKGACIGEENFLKYNLRFDEAFYKTKIKRWPFEGPIGVREKGPARNANISVAGGEKEEMIIIDKWCILGSLKNEADTLSDMSSSYAFDTDTYRILVSFLLKEKNITIIPLFQTTNNHYQTLNFS